MATMVAVLSVDNQSLLRLIRAPATRVADEDRRTHQTAGSQLVTHTVDNGRLRTARVEKELREFKPIALTTNFKILID